MRFFVLISYYVSTKCGNASVVTLHFQRFSLQEKKIFSTNLTSTTERKLIKFKRYHAFYINGVVTLEFFEINTRPAKLNHAIFC